MAAEDDVTLGELHRNLIEIRGELRSLKEGFVPRGEYNAHSKAVGERIGGIEKSVAKIEGTLSAINRTAWTGVLLPILVLILGAVLLAAVGLK